MEKDYKGIVSVKVFVDPETDNMGLQDQGYVLFPKAVQSEPLAYVTSNGIKRYLTGLDEFAPEVQSLPDDTKKAKITEIRKIVADLEKRQNMNVIDINDKDFWNKVKTFRPDNESYYRTFRLRYTNDDKTLFPEEDIVDLCMFYAIQAGGFPMCGKNFEDAQVNGKRWYLGIERDDVKADVSLTKRKNAALAKLVALYDDKAAELLYLAKVLDPAAANFKKSTFPDTLYKAIDDFINGKSSVTKISKAVELFEEAVSYNKAEMFCRAVLKDAIYFREVVVVDQNYMIQKKSVILGKNFEDCVQYLMNQLNGEVFEDLHELILKNYWSVS